MPSRIGFLDAIRGVAACLVMLQHALYQSGLLGPWPNGPLTGFVPTWLELGETGVVAFFLVSGFVIPLSLEKTADFGRFWLHRALRIYPLYIAVFVVTFLATGGASEYSLASLAAGHLLFAQDYLGQPNYVTGSWTLALELIWYIGISLLFLLALDRKLWLIVGASVLASLLAMLACALGHHVPMGRAACRCWPAASWASPATAGTGAS